ncbi:MAG: leucine-rich repeat protein [Clostridiales bacterium]|nr:leucine-rich repeat protein [Clostridiales bacterium]
MEKLKWKRPTAILLALALVFTLLPSGALAADADGDGGNRLAAYADTSDSTIIWTGEDGVQYTFDTSTGTITNAVLPKSMEVVIPSEIEGVAVEIIGESAFSANNQLTSVVIPGSVSEIEADAFSSCTNLTTATFETSDEVVVDENGTETVVHTGTTTMADDTFLSDTALVSVILPDTLTVIPGNFVRGCTSLESIEIPDSVTEIGLLAFYQCTSLTEITIPGSVQSMPGAFRECTGLVSVVMEDGSASIGEECFRDCTALETVTIPDSVTEIGNNAFRNCSSLKSCRVPEGVTELDEVFFNCTAMEEISLPGSLTAIGDYTFFNCHSLASDISLPNVTGIGDYAFEYCQKVTSVTFGESLTAIGDYAFDNTAITSISIPDSVTSLGEYAFQKSYYAESISIGSGITTIPAYAFYFCSMAADLEIRGAVTEIGDYAFSDCYAITDITLPDTVETIGDYSFYHCNNISEITIPTSTISIGDCAFGVCLEDSETGLHNVYVLNPYVEFGTDVFIYDLEDLTIYGYANSTAQAYAEENNHLFAELESLYRDLSVTVCDSDGNAITDGYTITWYDENGTAVFDSVWQVENVNSATNYTVEIVLDDDMLEYYVQPDPVTFTAGSEASVVVTLEDVNWLALTGQVLDPDGNGLGETAVTVTHQLLGKQYTTVTDETGTFSVNIPAAAVALKLQKDGYYSHTESLDLADFSGSSYDYGTYSLTAVAADGIILSVTLVGAAEDGADADTAVPASLARYDVSVTDESGNTIDGYEVQGSNIVFAENTVSAGQTVLVGIHDPNGEYQDSDVVSVTLDDNRVGMASLSMTQKGGFTFPSLDGPAKCSMSVLNSGGTVVLSENVSAGTAYTGLDAGEYTILLVQQSSLVRNILSEDYLTMLGLTEGTDYLKIVATVEDGAIAVLEGYEVPEFDESRITYTASSSITTSKPSGMTVGAAFTVRVSYDLDTSKSVDAVSVNVVFPEGVDPTYPQMAQVNGTTAAYTYDVSSRTATFYVSGEDSGVVTFYCTAGGTAGTYDLNIYLALAGGILQPLGTVRADVQDSSLSVPSGTGTETIIASGITAPRANVTIYDNDTVVAETTANAAGSWSTELVLAGKLYTYSYHYIYAVIDADVFDNGQAVTDEELVIYDERYIEVKKATMYNYGHSQQVTEFDYTSDSTDIPYYDYNPDYPTFTFKAEIEMSDETRALVENMYVFTVDQYGDRTYVTLAYDEETGFWVGSYDYTDPYTIPAAVGVGYDMDDSWYELPDDEEYYEDYAQACTECYNAILDYFIETIEQNYTFVYDESEEIGYSYCTDADTDEQLTALAFVSWYSEIEDGITAASLEEMGYSSYDADGNVIWFCLEEQEDIIIIHYVDFEENLVIENVMDFSYCMGSDTNTEESFASLSDLITFNGTAESQGSFSDITMESYSAGSDIKIVESNLYVGKGDKQQFDASTTISNALTGLSLGLAIAGDACLIAGAAGAVETAGLSGVVALLANGTMKYLSFLVGETANQITIDNLRAKYSFLLNKTKTMQSNLNTALRNVEALLYTKCNDGSSVFSTDSISSTQANTVSSIKTEINALGGSISDPSNAQIGRAISTVVERQSVVPFLNAVSIVANWNLGNSADEYYKTKAAETTASYNDILNKISRLRAILEEYIAEKDCDSDEDEDQKAAENETPYKPVNGNNDPSGYVYEAVPSNTVGGVTAVIYYKGEDGNAVVWNAEDYGQTNYQITDSSGAYQWYVPTGEWKVTFTKDGYLAADTSQHENADEDGWLPVPPPQLEINIGMVSTEAPTVESVAAYTEQIEVVFSQYMDMESADMANALNAVSLTRDGKEVGVTVTAVDAEYNLEGTIQYATRFAIVPVDGDISGELVLTIDAHVENYAGTQLGTPYTSDTLAVIERPTSITASNSVEAVLHEDTSFSVELNPCIADKTLTVETLTSGIVSVGEANVVTDETGRASITVTGNLPGTGYIVVTEPISGVSTTIEVNVVLESEGKDDSEVQPVTAYLEDGTIVTTGMTIPEGSFITLMTETEGATIRYTVNDTCPCKEAALYYTEPIEITEDTVLRAVAVVDGVYSSTIRLELSVAEGSASTKSDSLCVRRGNAYYFSYTIHAGDADKVIYYGRVADEVLVGDWDGDGVDTICVRRGNSY